MFVILAATSVGPDNFWLSKRISSICERCAIALAKSNRAREAKRIDVLLHGHTGHRARGSRVEGYPNKSFRFKWQLFRLHDLFDRQGAAEVL